MERLDTVDADGWARAPGSTRLTLRAGAGHSHLRLRRLYNPRERQEAEVWVNGRLAGRWYTAATNPFASETESDFLLPAVVHERLDVEIRPVRPGWSELRYELWGIP